MQLASGQPPLRLNDAEQHRTATTSGMEDIYNDIFMISRQLLDNNHSYNVIDRYNVYIRDYVQDIQ